MCDKDFEVLVNCEENPMRGTRPFRSLGILFESDIEVGYLNYFINVVRAV